MSGGLSGYVAGEVGSILSSGGDSKKSPKKAKSSKSPKSPLGYLFDGATTQGGSIVSKPQKVKSVLISGQIGDPQEDDRHPVATMDDSQGDVDRRGDNSKASPPKKAKRKKRTVEIDSDGEEVAEVKPSHRTRRRKNDYQSDPGRDQRTLFIGNLPLNFKKKQVLRLCAEFGQVSSVRFRSVSVADGTKSRRISVWKKEYSTGRQGQNAYVVFCEEEGAQRGLSLHNRVVEERHLNVDIASNDGHKDYKRTVFVGNLPRGIEDEAVRQYFEKECGEVDRVRLIRNPVTGEGKGFGYVCFSDRETVLLALKCHGEELEGRTLRVFRAQKPSDQQNAHSKHGGSGSHGDGKKSTSGLQATKGDVPKAFRQRSSRSSTPRKGGGKGGKKFKSPKKNFQGRPGKPGQKTGQKSGQRPGQRAGQRPHQKRKGKPAKK